MMAASRPTLNCSANASCRLGTQRSSFKAAGFTMVELVVGLVLLATLLVSMLMVISRQRKASRMAVARQQAVQAADQLLAGWFDAQAGIPLVGQGPVAGTNMLWQTRVARNVSLFEQAVPVVRLSIVEPNANAGSYTELRFTELLFIELLAPQGGQ